MSTSVIAIRTTNGVMGRRMFRWGIVLLAIAAFVTAFQSVIFMNFFDFGYEPYALIPIGGLWQTLLAIGTPLGAALLVGGIIVGRLPEPAPSVDPSAT